MTSEEFPFFFVSDGFQLVIPVNRHKPRKKKFATRLSWPFSASSVAAPNLATPQLRIYIINYYLKFLMFIRKYFLSFELKGQIQNYQIKFIFQFDKKV